MSAVLNSLFFFFFFFFSRYFLLFFFFCFTSFPSLPAAHAFVVIWRLVCTFCHALLAFYGMGYFPICHSLCLASFGDWALLDHGPFFPRPIMCSLCGLVSIFLSYHSAIPAVVLLNSILLGLLFISLPVT